ncbi:Chromate resistance protein ChrB [Microtetraspora malaysiensis]|uniref:Chromate resistance protein ChrB n=1 Tax=Microtetraspora malaysiensis TaxID=161358 RepID=A0ABW6SWK7_9ACTN
MTIDERFLQLVYRVPAMTSRARVAVWRELKRLGALYIQQAVCVLPACAGRQCRVRQ